jgi:hypothetical protein
MMKSLLILLVLSPLVARATLGEKADSVQTDQIKMKAQRQTETLKGNDVHVLKSSGRQVKEYVNSEGVVYAVTWRGSLKPDLQSLFGSYYLEFANADANSNSQHRPAKNFSSERLVVRRSGHLRDLRGVAYIKSLLPEGVRPEDIK